MEITFLPKIADARFPIQMVNLERSIDPVSLPFVGFLLLFLSKLYLNSNQRVGIVELLVAGKPLFSKTKLVTLSTSFPLAELRCVEKCGDQMMCKDQTPRNLWIDDDRDSYFENPSLSRRN